MADWAPTMAESIFDIAQRAFDSQPFSQYVGARLESVDEDEIEIALPVRAELLQQYGYVHGGVLSYLADNALTFAGGLALGGNALTSEFKINYLRPATGSILTARAWVIAKTRRQAVCACEVSCTDEEGVASLVAAAQGTIVSTSPPDG